MYVYFYDTKEGENLDPPGIEVHICIHVSIYVYMFVYVRVYMCLFEYTYESIDGTEEGAYSYPPDVKVFVYVCLNSNSVEKNDDYICTYIFR